MKTKKVNKFKKATSKVAFLFACAIVTSPCITSFQSCKATSEEIHSEVVCSSAIANRHGDRSYKTIKQTNRNNNAINTNSYAITTETETYTYFEYYILDYKAQYFDELNVYGDSINARFVVRYNKIEQTLTSADIIFGGYSSLAEDDFFYSYTFNASQLSELFSTNITEISVTLVFNYGEFNQIDSTLYIDTEDDTIVDTSIRHTEEFFFATYQDDERVSLFNTFDLDIFYTEIALYANVNENYDYVYNQGYNAGLTEGSQNGYENGFEDGKLASGTTYQDGYTKGYNDAKNQYQNTESLSFEDVLTSVITAPSKIIKEGFDFDILGINVGSLLQTVIVIGLVVFAIGMFKKG